MATFIVSMPANSHDGRRKTTKLTADEVLRKGDWLSFTRVSEDKDGELEETVAEFCGAESWLMEEVSIQGPRPAE